MRLASGLLLLLAAGLLADPAAGFEYTHLLSGPSVAYVGFPTYIQLDSKVVEGDKRRKVSYSVSGLPEGVEVRFPQLNYGGVERQIRPPHNMTVELIPDASVSPGIYEITIEADSEGVKKVASHKFEVVTPGNAPQSQTSATPVLTSRARTGSTKPDKKGWETRMLEAASRICNQQAIEKQGTWNGNVWFYDGIRVFYQMADYWKDPKWSECAGFVKDVYLNYVLQNEGRLQGFYVFPQGLEEDYQRSGDERSKQAVILLSTNSAYAAKGGAAVTTRSRETAYAIEAYLAAEALGEPRNENLLTAVSYAIGQLDEWFPPPWVDADGFNSDIVMQPFMVGLTVEALIKYYEVSGDPRIPEVVKNALERLWEHAWVARDKAFYYKSPSSVDKGAPDLNMLIAPGYAWLYSITGSSSYRSMADQIFNGGVRGAFLGSGKHFAQNYRWSFDFMKWRTAAKEQ